MVQVSPASDGKPNPAPTLTDVERSSVDVEKDASAAGSASDVTSTLKLDHHGLPLVPQPTDDPNDPLNWSYTKKYSILAIVSILSFFSTFALAVMNPACMCSSPPSAFPTFIR
jgi:hypothetical protein